MAATPVIRLNFDQEEHRAAVDTLMGCLSDTSSIVKTCVTQAVADIAQTDEKCRPALWVHIRKLTQTGTPAMNARERRLLAQVEG